ncbi:hypothetical protein [Fischerella thermalis]|nr:hypothetical protein [Fischerella thermalis]
MGKIISILITLRVCYFAIWHQAKTASSELITHYPLPIMNRLRQQEIY